MLRKQHKVDASHYDIPLIYYTEGHSLHFDRPEFALITGLPFGHVNFGLYTFGELKFRNRVFPHKLGLSVTNLDVIGVIEDEETFQKLCDEDSIRLCLILCLEVIFMGRLLTCPVDDTLFWFGSLSHLKDAIIGGLKIQMVYQEQLVGQKSQSLTDLIVVTFLKRNRPQLVISGLLKFNEEFSRLGCEFMNSLNILFVELSQSLYTDENLFNDYLVEEELRLCLEAEERMCLEHEKNIIEEQRFRVNEAKRMKLEEEKLLEISELKKKRQELMNSSHVKSILGKLTHTKGNHVDSMSGKTKAIISNDLLVDEGKNIKCKFPWSDDYTVGQNFWLTLVCLDPTQKGWLSEEHIVLWVDISWHGRPKMLIWAKVSLLCSDTSAKPAPPCIMPSVEKYSTTWSEWLIMYIFPINKTLTLVSLPHFDIFSGLSFYDSGDTYEYESHDLYVRVRECLQTQEQMIKMQPFLHLSTVLAESYNLIKELQDYALENYKDLMKSISETQLRTTKVFEKKGIDPTDYSIRFKLADPVPKQGGIFGDCGYLGLYFLYRLAHDISLDVEDPIDVALAYREKINATSHLEHLNGLIEMLEGMHFTLEIYDNVLCLRETVKSENKKLLDLKKQLVDAKEDIKVKEKCLDILEEAIYSTLRKDWGVFWCGSPDVFSLL
ncbi:hypothetical protein Tco_0563967 [Tanacetum coccineum]